MYVVEFRKCSTKLMILIYFNSSLAVNHWFLLLKSLTYSRKTNKLCLVLMKSKGRSTDFASDVKIDKASDVRCILLWFSDITAQPTFDFL